MTRVRVRSSALQRGSLGRTVFLLALVGGVLIGLLAMHTISSGAGEQMTSAFVMSAETSHASGHGDPVVANRAESPAHCDGLCDPGHLMANMACVLALLFSALVLALAPSRTWSSVGAALRNRWLSIVAVAVAAVPPPNLHALSISRT